MFLLEEIDDEVPSSLRDLLPLTPQDDLVASLAEMPAGTGLAVQLAGLDFPALSEAQLLDAARAWERQERWLAARRNELCAALRAAPGPAWDGHPAAAGPEEWDSLVESARDRSLAASVGLSPYAAAERVDAAAQLAPGGRLAATGQSLASGRIPEPSARLIAVRLRDLDDALAAAVQSAVLPHAELLTHRKLERILAREIATQHAALGVLDHELARAERRVGPPRRGENGSASLQVVGPAEDIQVLHTALTALGEATKAAAAGAARANGDSDEGRHGRESLDVHRFDALINLACAALADTALPTRHGCRASLAITVPAAVLLGLSHGPADLDGHGPISAAAARRLAMDPSATWRRILTDPAGGCSTTAPPRTARPVTWPTWSSFVTGRARSPAASARPGSRSWTTWSRSRAEARARRTSARPAGGSTTSRPPGSSARPATPTPA